MKTPDKIKKGLMICYGGFMDCAECPYHQTPAACMKLSEDALEYILQLEFKLRDATEDVKHLENQLADAGKKVAQLEAAQPKWISVEERLPDKSGEVLICVYGHVTIAWYSVNRFETGGGMVFFVDDHFADGNEVTHWMPLPQPPKEESYGTKGTAEVEPHVRPARGE